MEPNVSWKTASVINSRAHRRIDVLSMMNLQPMKMGSIEDYVIQLSTQAHTRGLTVGFVFGPECSPMVQQAFEDSGVIAFGVQQTSSSRTLAHFIHEFRPWAVHFHFFSQCEPLYVAAHSRYRLPTIVSAHLSLDEKHTSPWGVLDAARRARRRLYATQVDRYLAVSSFVANDLSTSGAVPSAKVQLIYNGVDLGRHCLRSAEDRSLLKRELLGISPDETVVTFIGQMEPFKGVMDIIEAIPLIAAMAPNTRFLFVGSGSLDAAPGLDHPAVIRLGLRDDTHLLLGASDIFWMPSRWQEAFGLVLAEASAAGVPVVATRMGGIPEVIVDRKSGFLIERGDVPALVARVVELIRDSALRKHMGIMGRAHVERMFSLHATVNTTLDCYQSFRPNVL